MENRNFHTAFLGGFRKKDVVNFLAEDKRRQEENLQELNAQLEEASEQIKQLMEQRDNALEQVQALCAQREELQAELEAARQESVQLETARQENARLESELQQQNRRNGDLQAQLAQLQEQLDARPEVDPEELQSLREELQAARLRAEALDARLREQPQSKGGAQSTDQLWNLCGKMERTLRQMERMLDGPYRMTCYPEPMEQVQEAAEPVMQEETFAPVAEQPARVQAPSVKNLLQRVRIKR
jgi:DNA repair exonuclease SbcCD ATPase subunit